jgi:hypothetical protein
MIELDRTLTGDVLTDRDEVWLARGLQRRWRVRSERHTFGEWDELADATEFLRLLVEGNPQLEALS